MRGLARLVVLDDPAGAEGVEIDPVDLSRERERAEIETALELLGRALRAERNLEPPRHQLQLRGGLVPEERLEVAEQPLLELLPLQVGQLHPDASHRLGEALAQELERVVELFGPELFDAEPLRDAGEELVQGAMSDLTAEARVDDLVDRRLAHEVQPPRRARARGVEEVAVARHGVRLREPRAAQTRVELACGLLVEERRRLAATRQRSLLEAEHEDDLVTARARAQEIDDVDPASLSRAGGAHRYAFDGCDDLVGSQRATESEPALELVDDAGQGLERAQILAGFLADRRGLEPVGGAEHEAGEVAQRRERRLRLAEELERGERVSVAEPHRLLFRPLAGLDGAAPEPTFDPIDARAGETRVGGAQEPVQHSAAAALPGESKQRDQGAPELGLFEADPTFDRIRHTEGAERGLERRAVALDARTDECDLLRRGSAADQREQLFGDSLENAASAGALEEAEGAVQRDAALVGIALVREERPLEVRERRRPDLGPRR